MGYNYDEEISLDQQVLGNKSTKVFVSDSTVLGTGFIEKLEAEGCEVILSDDKELASAQDLSLYSGFQSDIVFHTAEKSPYTDRQNDSDDDSFDFNVQVTKKLCAAIDQWAVKPKAFFYMSTVSVYGVHEGLMINENHPLNGTSPYAKSKIEAEDFLIDWAYQHKIILSILRLPSFIASEHSKGLLGTMINAMKAGKYLRIGAGEAQKSVIWAEDLASLVCKIPLIEGRYNLTDGRHPSTKELEDVIRVSSGIRKISKVPFWIAKAFALIGDALGNRASLNSSKLIEITAPLTFDDHKARKVFGWKSSDVLMKLAKPRK